MFVCLTDLYACLARTYRCLVVRCFMVLCRHQMPACTPPSESRERKRPSLTIQGTAEAEGKGGTDNGTHLVGNLWLPSSPPATRPLPLGPLSSAPVANATTTFEWREWKKGPRLATGRYGKVHVWTRRAGKKASCVVKTQLVDTRVTSEVACLKGCDHPHIVKWLGDRVRHGWSQLAMVRCPGQELFDYIVATPTHLPLPLVRKLSHQLLDAVRYLHEKRIMHRDIKPENILFDPTTERLQLVDFGFACQWEGNDDRRYSYVGTPYYTAHEMVYKRSHQSYTSVIDEWSTGVVVFILMYRSPPFYGDTDEAIFRRIRKGNIPFPNDVRSTDAVECIRGLLCVVAAQRRTAAASLQLSWFAPV